MRRQIWVHRGRGITQRRGIMLVSTAELAMHLKDPDWVVFDCRHDLADHGKGGRLYAAGHVPGAHFAAVETMLSGVKTGSNGRHPLPSPQDFAAFLARHGVTPGRQIVAYDDVGGMYAARLWWLARWVGLGRVALLDGGWPKWTAEARMVAADASRPVPAAPISIRLNERSVWSADEVSRHLTDPDFLLIDARAGERYRGEVEPMDPVAGHIPGAVHRFYRANLNADLTLRPAVELRREFMDLIGERSPGQVGHQCGSGITACANLFAMEYAGLGDSKLYAGSWSEWVSDPSRPVATGEG